MFGHFSTLRMKGLTHSSPDYHEVFQLKEKLAGVQFFGPKLMLGKRNGRIIFSKVGSIAWGLSVQLRGQLNFGT